MTRLILHIGAAKCGSSAIQKSLSVNSRVLRDQGVIIPSAKCELEGEILGQQIWFFEKLRQSDADPTDILRNRLIRVNEGIQREGATTIVLSAENLINPYGMHKFFEGIDKYFDIEIFLYVRRQDDYILSAWQQWYVKKFKNIYEYLREHSGNVADWNTWIQPWEELFGPEKITVRRFSRKYLVNNDVVDDFFASTGLDPKDCLNARNDANRSFDESIVRMASKVNDAFESIHDNRFYEAMLFAIGEKAFKDGKGSQFLSLHERLEILARYEEGNCALKKKYFPDLPENEALFDPPNEMDVVNITDEQAREREQEALIRAVYGLANKIRDLETKK